MFRSLTIYKVILCICLFFVATAFGEFSFDHWSTENGLPHNTVRQIVQTPDGYLWITTFDGLARFDGVRFTVFNSLNTKEITDNRFFGAFVDKDGTLWASMLNGSIIRYRDRRFESFQVVENVSRNSIVGFQADDVGNILTRTRRANKTKAFQFVNGKFELAPKKYHNQYKQIFLSQSGKLWTITKKEVIESFNGETTNYPLELKLNWDGNWKGSTKYFEDKSGAFWIGDTESLYKLHKGKVQTYSVINDSKDKNRKHIQPRFEDDEGYIWFVVKNNGPARIKRFKDGETEDILNNGELFTSPQIVLFKDKEGLIWIGSEKGLFRIRNNSIQTFSDRQGLEHENVYTILERKNGEIIIGGGVGVSIYKNGKFSLLKKEGILRTIHEDANENLWIRGKTGLSVISKNGTIKELNNFVGARIKTIQSDSKGNVWVSTPKGLFKTRDFEVIEKYTKKDGLPNNNVDFILEAKNGALWFGTQQGISKLENEKFTNYSIKDGLAGNRIRTIYEDSDRTLWVGTYGNGLSRFKDGKFFNYSSNEGLYHNSVFQIFEDKNENFWIGGNQGIYRVAKRELNDFADRKIKHINSVGYGKEDGMPSVEVNGGWQPAGMIASDGKLWFPTMGGITIIDPNNIKTNPNVPNALIEEVTIEREPTEFRDGLTVGVGKDDVEIHYTAPSFIKPKQIRFKYKMEGINEDWIEAGTRRTAYYSYLPPGDYTFRLLVANSDGVWNEKETTLQIRVLAPFYRTNWFYASVILGIIGIAFLLHRYRVAQFEKRNELQVAFSRQLITLQEDERKRIAAGLHDGLSHQLIIIKNWSAIALQMLKSGRKVEEQLEEISETSLQALNEVREITNDLRPHKIDNLGLTDTIKSMVKKAKSASGINFELEADAIDHLLNKEDEVIFYRIIQECINNVIKHSEAKNAFVSIKNGSNTIKVRISDDGKGFIQKDKSIAKIKSGFGLTGIVERIKMLGGKQTINSELGKGTTIDIKIELH